MKRKSFARAAVFIAAGVLGVISAVWGSNGDSETSGGVTAPMWTISQ